jgi:formyl-CoA transferase
MVVDLAHPALGTVKTLGTPIRPAGAPALRPAPPPGLGADTDAVLGELLGYPADRIAALRATGVIA